MSKRKNKSKVRNGRTLLLKLPLYLVPLKKESKGLFGALDENEMVDNLLEQLKTFPYTELPTKGKFKRTAIEKLNPTKITLDSKPCVLVQASVFDTNLEDTYLKTNASNKSKIERNSSIGGENYFILFYPKIEGSNSQEYIYTWLQIVYEDPTHAAGIATSVAKKISQKIINTESFNIKLASALDEIRKLTHIPQVQVELTTVSHGDNADFPQFNSSFVSAKVSEKTTYLFEHMPAQDVEQLFKSTDQEGVVSITKKAIWGKREIRVKRESINDLNELKESIDQIFNYSCEVSEEDVQSGKIFLPEFLSEKFSCIISNYLTNS